MNDEVQLLLDVAYEYGQVNVTVDEIKQIRADERTKTINIFKTFIYDINEEEIKSHIGTGTEVSWLMNWRNAFENELKEHTNEGQKQLSELEDPTSETTINDFVEMLSSKLWLDCRNEYSKVMKAVTDSVEQYKKERQK